MRQVRSRDGTPIAYECRGNGVPLVLIHGAGADHTRWNRILPELEKHFTVYAVDRRGRGQSGDTGSSSIEREAEDVVAVVDSISVPVSLVGHSYGAICSLEASLQTSNLSRLILYEPPINSGVKRNDPSDALDRMKAHLQAGEAERALLIFLREIAEVKPEEINFLRSLPTWPSRVAAAHTLPCEEAAVRSYVPTPHRFSKLRIPTLLLLGGDSPSFYRGAIEALKGSIPESRISTMPGQRHAAMDTAPDLFLREVIGFLTEKR